MTALFRIRGSAGTSRENLPPTSRVSRLDGVGHIPMLEAPGRITELIAGFVDEHTASRRAPGLSDRFFRLSPTELMRR